MLLCAAILPGHRTRSRPSTGGRAGKRGGALPAWQDCLPHRRYNHRYSMRPLLIPLVFSLSLYAQEPAAIQGIVVNAVTGEPIAGVHVTIMVRLPDVGLSSAYGAMSDTAGRFSVSAMAPGTYFPRPERAGFFFARAKDPSAGISQPATTTGR